MAYSKQTWIDNNLTYPVSAARMGHIEDGVEAVTNSLISSLSNLPHNVRDPIGIYAGLTGDGTDETTLAQAHIDAARAAGRAVYWPPAPSGAYVVTQLHIDSNDVWFTGLGAGRAWLKMANGTANSGGIWAIIRLVGSSASNFAIIGLGLNGNRANSNHASEFTFGIHTSDATDFEISYCEIKNFRGDGIYVGQSAGTPARFAIHHNRIHDTGIKESGDSFNTRQGVSVIAGSDFDISNNLIYDVGSVGIDLEANTGTQTFVNALIANNRIYNCANFFVNIAPTVAANATGIEIIGNIGRISGQKGISIKAASGGVVGNTLLGVADIGINLGFQSLKLVIVGNTVETTSSLATPRNNIYLDSATSCVVTGNVLLGTAGTAGVVETSGSDFNYIGPNVVDNTTKYTISGTNTATDYRTRNQSYTVAPPSGGASLVLTGTSGTVDCTVGALTLKSASQIIFGFGATEQARFNSSGHFVTAGARQVQAGGGVQIGGGTVILKHLSGTVTWDPPSLAAGAQTTKDVSVTGAALGDVVAVGFDKDLQGMQISGYVSATNTVTVVLRNGTGGVIDLASGTLRADVWQH